MGYTHYWRTDGGLVIDDTTYAKIVEGIKQISATAQEAGVDISEDYEADELYINGVGQYEHETFIFGKTLDEFNFCKTAGKPYDMVVTASLIYAKKILGDALTIKSDGNWNDWDGGRLLYESTFDEIPTQEEVFA
jgi:hypothetical protein